MGNGVLKTHKLGYRCTAQFPELTEHFSNSLTLSMLEPKVIGLCHQSRARHYMVAGQHKILISISPELIMNSSKNGRWNSTFEKFSRAGVKFSMYIV